MLYSTVANSKNAMTDLKSKADALKDKGNQELKQNHFEKAVEFYTEAISLKPNPIYYSNRAQAQIKLENYGLAIADATSAIELDPSYLKAYYRRAVATFAILDYRKAKLDVKMVLSKVPNDPNSKKLAAEIDQIIKRIAFEKAIAVDEKESVIQELDFNAIQLENDYDGAPLEIEVTGKGQDRNLSVNITQEYLKQMIQRFKNGKKLPKKHAFAIVAAANEVFKNEHSLVEFGFDRNNSQEEALPDTVKTITICGDTHGQFYDVLNIFESFGNVGPNHVYLFNGDFVDRGSWSCEVAFLLFTLKLLYPKFFYLNRGNHETNSMNKVYGFEDECKYKYGERLFTCFSEAFNSLPYATLIGQEYLVMHGGLFSDDKKTLQDIRNIKRVPNRQPPNEGVEMELLWTDPQVMPGRSPSKRGVGIQFGPDITYRFCRSNNLKAIIRSHEVRMGGYEEEHDGKLITVFSAPNYCDTQGNLGAVVNLTSDEKKEYRIDFKTFKEVPHPDIKPMAYTNSGGF